MNSGAGVRLGESAAKEALALARVGTSLAFQDAIWLLLVAH
ncbi:hypothetical protein AB0C96_39190 [Streptomyces sp. NPDC048506]